MNKELAALITRKIFAIGDSYSGNKCQRIQFMGGKWPDEETNNGGMNEDALCRFMEELLDTLPESQLPKVTAFNGQVMASVPLPETMDREAQAIGAIGWTLERTQFYGQHLSDAQKARITKYFAERYALPSSGSQP